MSKEYNHRDIEKKWQETWDKNNAYATGNKGAEKRYVLDMFPYPSGQGLHVGHPKGYIATDIYSRFLRIKGYDVLHPMGWDSFGLPAENYAIKTKIHPKETIRKAKIQYKDQIKSLSLSYDWDREITTSDPEYYRWTQWLFLELYKNGLAYKKEAKVNWCESCKTVLANEQVVDNACDRCKGEVIQKSQEQWFFKITEFADDLIKDLKELDWPESTKINQENWIGKSEGAELTFKVKDSNDVIKVFTTRPDTLFGATYMVLAPEHELIEKLKPSIRNWSFVEKYVKKAISKTELERLSDGKDKTGMVLDGVMAINPANNEEIPIFVADYVLSGYGTGAIMAVPAHDDRDREFAEKYDLPIIEVNDGEKLVSSGEFDGVAIEEAKKSITEKVGGIMKTTYRLRDWSVGRQRYWGAPIPIIYCDKCGEVPVPVSDLPVTLPDDVDFVPTGESPLKDSKTFHSVKCPKCDSDAERESDTLDTFVCSSWYFFRFTDPTNFEEFASKKAINDWMPVDMYVGGAEHTVLHLMYSRFITKALKRFGYIDFKEPFDTLRHQGMIIAEDGRKMSKSFNNIVNPDDVIDTYGSDTMRLYEMFMGPFKDSISWSTSNILGVRRFIEKVWRLQDYVTDSSSKELEILLHQTIKKTEEDIKTFKFNTAISSFMVFANKVEEEKKISKDDLKSFLKILSPFAPHITEEMWFALGETTSISKSDWPKYSEDKLSSGKVVIAIQINGKAREEIEINEDENQDSVIEKVKETDSMKKRLEGREIKKVIYVKGKIINIVLGS